MDLWKPEMYSDEAAYTYEEAAPVLYLLHPREGERILDLGCGTGELTKALADAGCNVTGVDASPAMVRAARAKGLDICNVDALDMNFKKEFDAVFSNYALHWMKEDPQRVIRNVRASLKTGGRFVGEIAALNSISAIFPAVEAVFERRGLSFAKRSPWFLPTMNQYKRMLENEGFEVEFIWTRARDIPLPHGPIWWLELFGQDLFQGIKEHEKQQLYEEIEEEIDPSRVNQNVQYFCPVKDCRNVYEMDHWKPETYSKEAAYVYEDAAPVLYLLHPRAGEKILDLGCGTGELTKALADAGCNVTGVDASRSMVRAAKAKGLDICHVDAHEMHFKNKFDAVFSNYALHWMKEDPQRVIRNVKASLRVGGRFVGELPSSSSLSEMFPAMEVVFERRGLSFAKRNPWFNPTMKQYKEMLENEGFDVEYITLRPRDIPLPHGPIWWLKLFAQDLFQGIAENEKQQMYNEIKAEMGDFKVNNKGEFVTDYLGIVFSARSAQY